MYAEIKQIQGVALLDRDAFQENTSVCLNLVSIKIRV